MTVLFMERKDGGISFTNLSHINGDLKQAIFLATHYATVTADEDRRTIKDENGKVVYKKYEWIKDQWIGTLSDIPSDKSKRDEWVVKNRKIIVPSEE